MNVEGSAEAAALSRPPFALAAPEVVSALGSDSEKGLTASEAEARRSSFGPNEITSEKPPSTPAIAMAEFKNPMNLMLVAVTVVSFAIGEISTGVIVALLIALNVVLGTRQELKARASVDALSKLQVPQAKALRDGDIGLVAAVELVPGDILRVETGSRVPADGRLIESVHLQLNEASLTGESLPVAKQADPLAPQTDLAERSNLVFMGSVVSAGRGTVVVVRTG